MCKAVMCITGVALIRGYEKVIYYSNVSEL